MSTRRGKEKRNGSDWPISARFLAGAVGVMIPFGMSGNILDDPDKTWVFFTYLIAFGINAGGRTGVRAVFRSALVAFGDKMLVDPTQDDVLRGALAWLVVGALVSIVAVWLTLLPVGFWVHWGIIFILMILGVSGMMERS